jgi:hypothetical protein
MNSLMAFLGKLMFSRKTAPEVTRRNTRAHLIQPLKERIVREVGYGLSLEGASAADLVKSMQTNAAEVVCRGKRGLTVTSLSATDTTPIEFKWNRNTSLRHLLNVAASPA